MPEMLTYELDTQKLRLSDENGWTIMRVTPQAIMEIARRVSPVRKPEIYVTWASRAEKRKYLALAKYLYISGKYMIGRSTWKETMDNTRSL